MLAGRHYGERWARHWLDVVRFGESEGFEYNHVRDHAWRYRDWVIQAFNGDLPYDEFVRRQIAGDVLYPGDLDALIATGYHGDMTRTIVHGSMSDGVKRMFDAVQAAKACAESRLRHGAQGDEIHKAVEESFKDAGFETGERDGRMVGFFHGTGHGLGLAVHEHPGIGNQRVRAQDPFDFVGLDLASRDVDERRDAALQPQASVGADRAEIAGEEAAADEGGIVGAQGVAARHRRPTRRARRRK